MNKCSKCNSSNITHRINYDFGEEWDKDRDDNVIHCLDCGHEIDDNTNIKKCLSTLHSIFRFFRNTF